MRRKTKKALAKVSKATGVAVAAIVTEIIGDLAARGIRKSTRRAIKKSRRKARSRGARA